MDNLGRLSIVDVIIQKQPHLSRVPTKNNELYALVASDGAIGQNMSELKFRLSVSHKL